MKRWVVGTGEQSFTSVWAASLEEVKAWAGADHPVIEVPEGTEVRRVVLGSSPSVKRKARTVTSAVWVDETTCRVRSPRTDELHVVQFFEEHVLCTCVHGLNAAGAANCYHVVAAAEAFTEKEQ